MEVSLHVGSGVFVTDQTAKRTTLEQGRQQAVSLWKGYRLTLTQGSNIYTQQAHQIKTCCGSPPMQALAEAKHILKANVGTPINRATDTIKIGFSSRARGNYTDKDETPNPLYNGTDYLYNNRIEAFKMTPGPSLKSA